MANGGCDLQVLQDDSEFRIQYPGRGTVSGESAASGGREGGRQRQGAQGPSGLRRASTRPASRTTTRHDKTTSCTARNIRVEVRVSPSFLAYPGSTPSWISHAETQDFCHAATNAYAEPWIYAYRSMRAIRGTIGTVTRLTSPLAPRTDRIGELLKHFNGRIPVDTGVGDAHTALEPSRTLCRNFLGTLVEMRLYHHADDGVLAFAKLVANDLCDLRLVLVVLLRVAWDGVSQGRRQ